MSKYKKIKLTDEVFDILGWYKYYGVYCLIAKQENEEYYTPLFHKDLAEFWKLPNLLKTLPEKYKNNIDFDKKNRKKEFYKLNEEVLMQVMFDLEDKWVITLHNIEDNSQIYSFEHQDLIKGLRSQFVLNDINKYKNKKTKNKEKIFNSETDLRKFAGSDYCYHIIKPFNVSLYFDFNGTLRFKSQKISRSTTMIELDLNKAWSHYRNGKNYSIKDIMNYYIETESSLSLFFDRFYEVFFVEDCTEGSEEYIFNKINEGIKTNE